MEARPAAAGALGPRLAGRLTAAAILSSPQYMSCVGNYEIDLRGNKIGAIENLGATENQFDSIDLSDNTIARLDGFPKLQRLKVLLLNNNRVAKIARGLEACIPNLHTLVLTNNRINELKDLDPLSTLPKLQTLSLIGNPVATKAHYRLYVIARLPKLSVLDFKKVKQKEREEAARLHGADAAAQAAEGGKTFEPGEGLPEVEAMEADGDEAAGGEEDEQGGAEAPKATSAPSAEQLTAIKAAIANAQTLEEVRALEAALLQGALPSQVNMGQNGAGAMEQD